MVLILVAMLLVLTAALAYVGIRVNQQVTRIPGVFSSLTDRPAGNSGAAVGALNILLLGLDKRFDLPDSPEPGKPPAWAEGAQRSDSMMVLHLSADRRSASVISIPRDSWVTIPGRGVAKINAAYSWGGPSLAVSTVEHLTGVRIDHVAVVDWDGYKAMINALGGVDVTIPQTSYDSYRKITWHAGRQHLTGAEALQYAGERAGLPGGDLDRVKRQQAVLRTLSTQALAAATDPVEAYQLVSSLAQHLAIDAGWGVTDLVKLLVSVRHLGAADVDYLTIPTSGTGRAAGQSVVWVDRTGSAELWKAVRSDQVPSWSADHPDALTGGTVR